jgi:hypothetical protein
LSVSCVGLTNVTLLTVTPVPETVALTWLGNPAPGSKKPEPETTAPVSVTFTFDDPRATVGGVHALGVAGSGARNCVTRTHHELLALQNSWNVHIVMSSAGSTTVCE